MNKKIYKRCFLVAVVTCVCLGVIGGVLHSPIDILSGATPKSQRTSTSKLSGPYVLVMNTTVPPLTSAESRQALQQAFVRKDAPIDALQGQSLRLAYPSNDDALAAYSEALQTRLQQQGMTVTLQPIEPVMLRSRLLVGKYMALIGSADDFTIENLPHQEVIPLKGYELR